MTDALGDTVRRPVYTAADVAAALGCSAWFVKEQVRRGRVDCTRIGLGPNGRIQFDERQVEQLRSLLTPPRPEPKRRRRRRT